MFPSIALPFMMSKFLGAKRILSSWGFNYSPDKGGWWREDTE
jgi:hypothetical protein